MKDLPITRPEGPDLGPAVCAFDCRCVIPGTSTSQASGLTFESQYIVFNWHYPPLHRPKRPVMRTRWKEASFMAIVMIWTVVILGSPVAEKRATICNGHAELCTRRYSNVTFIGAHDSFAYSIDPLALARDQEVDISTQLTLGVRLLQAQAHLNRKGVLHFCHTSDQ